ncbi:hypothetical protein V2S66_00550 [Streptomyces sp. V4-01]|uniref:Uncharacterized protein n=1 Tax=Actinacidiphila polyblastidii TaxID=3110430 RepID=A0ABU7P5S1_9ACTN|nr:hypothetical protein [Streptomyces sp. V4-01]
MTPALPSADLSLRRTPVGGFETRLLGGLEPEEARTLVALLKRVFVHAGLDHAPTPRAAGGRRRPHGARLTLRDGPAGRRHPVRRGDPHDRP